MILNIATSAHAKRIQPHFAVNFGVAKIQGIESLAIGSRFLTTESPPGMVLLLIDTSCVA
jgi:hypothetical protein